MKGNFKRGIAILLTGILLLSLVFVNPMVVLGNETDDESVSIATETDALTGQDAEFYDDSANDAVLDSITGGVGLDSTTGGAEGDSTTDGTALGSGTAEESTSEEPREVEGAVSVKIGGEPAVSDTPFNVKDGTQVEVTYDFKILNSYNLQLNEHCYFELPLEGVELTKSKGIIVDMGKTLGEWKYENGRLEFWFTDEDFLSKSNITGVINLDAKINLADVALDDEGNGKIKIADKDYKIHADKGDIPSEVEATKSVGEVEYYSSNRRTAATYTLEIKAKKDTKDVLAEDEWGSKLKRISEITLVSNKTGNLVQGRDYIFTRNGDLGFECKISSMDEGEIITITYVLQADASLYGTYDKNAANNTLTVTDRFGNGPDPQEEPFPDGSITVEKTGKYEIKDGTVTWTITINNPHKIDLRNVKISDVCAGLNELYDVQSLNDIVYLDGKPTSATIRSLINGCQFGNICPDNTFRTEYVITYSMKVKDEYKNKVTGTTDTNTVTLKDEDTYTINTSDEDTVGIGPKNYITGKKGEFVSDDEIKWTITLDVPFDLNDVVLHDEYDNTMTLNEESVEITKQISKNETKGIDKSQFRVNTAVSAADAGKMAFEIEFIGDANPLSEGTYEITYTTTCLSMATEAKPDIYNNKVKIKANGGEWDKDVSAVVKTNQLFEKRVYDSTSATSGSKTYYGTTVQNWELQLSKFKNMNGTSYRIQDVWASEYGYEYVSGSLIACESRKSDKQYPLDDKSIVHIENGIEFDITDAIKYAQNNGWKSMSIIYQTKISGEDEKKFLNSYNPEEMNASKQPEYNVKNTATLLKGSEPLCVSDTVTATSKPRAVVDKEGVYDADTIPNAKYKISVNPGGNDLLKGSDTLVLKDTMPEDFKLVKNTLKVYHANIKAGSVTDKEPNEADLLNSSLWSYQYDPITNVLTITIPDETEVIIVYEASVEMKAGTELNEDNACNSIELSGVTANSGSDKYTTVGVVLGSGATASSVTATLGVYKSSSVTQELLSGAKFSLKMVDYDASTGKVTEPATTPQGYNGAIEFVTGEDGSYTVNNLYFDKIYELTETAAPEGYIKDDTPQYIVFIGHDNENFNEDRDKVNYPEGTHFYEMETKTIIIENDEIPKETTDTSTGTTTETTVTTTNSTSAKTGDVTDVGLIITMMLTSAVAIVLLGLKRKREK